MTYQEEQERIQEAHKEAANTPYAILRLSERRWAVINLSGSSSIMANGDGGYVGYRHATFVDGAERLTFEGAREKIRELLGLESLNR